MKWLLTIALTSVLLCTASPVKAAHTVWHIRCAALTDRINTYRSNDLSLKRLLCRVGRDRSLAQAKAGKLWHDLTPVMNALNNAGVCWRNVGEVLAWNNYSGSATIFINQWKGSSVHWNLLMNTSFNRGGGSWINYNGEHYATYYVLDTC